MMILILYHYRDKATKNDVGKTIICAYDGDFKNERSLSIMSGQDVKDLLRKERLYQWELAAALEISEFTLSRWLRGALDDEREEAILQAIDRMKAQE